MLLSPFTVKVLNRLEFEFGILVLNVSSKQKEKRSQAASLYDKCNDGD